MTVKTTEEKLKEMQTELEGHLRRLGVNGRVIYGDHPLKENYGHKFSEMIVFRVDLETGQNILYEVWQSKKDGKWSWNMYDQNKYKIVEKQI